MNAKAFILNRKGLYLDSIMLDKEIIRLDVNNHASYARLIHNNIRLNNIKEANNNANLLRMKFSKNVYEKYQEYFLLLEKQNKEDLSKSDIKAQKEVNPNNKLNEKKNET